MLFLLTDLDNSFPAILVKLHAFWRTFSNLKINFDKSEALDINVLDRDLWCYKWNFRFKWAPDHIHYLGTNIQVFALNLQPLTDNIKRNLKKWVTIVYTWFEWNNVLQINILPTLLYPYQMLPFSFLCNLQSLFPDILLTSKKTRLKHTTLRLPKHRGGIGFPDPIVYCEVTTLAQTVDWCALEKPNNGLHLNRTSWCSHFDFCLGYTWIGLCDCLRSPTGLRRRCWWSPNVCY